VRLGIDVGHNQIIWRLREDPRVVVQEGITSQLEPDQFPVRFESQRSMSIADLVLLDEPEIDPSQQCATAEW